MDEASVNEISSTSVVDGGGSPLLRDATNHGPSQRLSEPSLINDDSVNNGTQLCTPSGLSLFTIVRVPSPTTTFTDDNILTYVCGVCINKLSKIHSCDPCLRQLRNPTNSLNQPAQLFTFCKAFSRFGDDFGALNIPSENFVNSMRSCDIIFSSMISDAMHHRGLVAKNHAAVCRQLSSYWFVCDRKSSCFRHFQSLFAILIRLRIFCILKYLNEKICHVDKTKRNRKLCVLQNV